MSNLSHAQFDTLNWNKPRSIKGGVYPVAGQENNKSWPRANRIDDVLGDRNLM